MLKVQLSSVQLLSCVRLFATPWIAARQASLSITTSQGKAPFQSTWKSGKYQKWVQFSSVQFSRSVVSDSLQSHELQHARLPCPSPTPGVHSNSCPLSWWCHPTISSSVLTFSSCLQSFPASGSFRMNQLFTSGGQSIGVSALASVLTMSTRTDLL